MTKETGAEVEDPMEAAIQEALADKKLAARYRNVISHLVEVRNTLPDAIKLRVLQNLMDQAELESVQEEGAEPPDADMLEEEIVAALVEGADLQEFLETVSLVLSGQESPKILLVEKPGEAAEADPLMQLGHAIGLLVLAVMEAQEQSAQSAQSAQEAVASANLSLDATAPPEAPAEVLVDCPACGASGRLQDQRCPVCAGQKKILVG